MTHAIVERYNPNCDARALLVGLAYGFEVPVVERLESSHKYADAQLLLCLRISVSI